MSIQSGTYALDTTHSTVGFVVRHAMVTKVRGNFDEFDATVNFDAENPSASSTSATIKSASINTNNADRDAHLHTADFFDTEKFPELTFNSTSVEFKNSEKAVVTGDLTIKGITKSVALDVELLGSAEDPFGNTRVGFEARTVINRKDFGIDFNAPLNTGGVLLSEDIKIEIEGSAIKQ